MGFCRQFTSKNKHIGTTTLYFQKETLFFISFLRRMPVIARPLESREALLGFLEETFRKKSGFL